MRLGRVISAALLALVALIATARMSCTVNIGLPQQPAPAVPQAPHAKGENAPPLLGLPADFKAKADEAYKAFPAPFRIHGAAGDAANRKKQALLFKAELAIEAPGKPKGEFFPCRFQQSSDCVSMGVRGPSSPRPRSRWPTARRPRRSRRSSRICMACRG